MSFPIKIQKVQVQQNDGTISNPIPLSIGVNIRQGEVETAVDIAHDEPIGAYSEYSVASGQGTKATAPNQAVVGQYNAENNDALFIVGDGTSESARSNAFEVLKNNTTKAKNLIVENNLTVRGTTTSINSEVLTVADNMIVTNSLGEDIDSLSGLAIRKNQTDVYGIAYDSTDDTVKLGLGTIGADNNFTFNSGDGQAIATREGLENGDLVEWNTEKNTLVPTQERAKIGSAIVDNEVAYQKETPENAASYAEIKKIGGMTRKCKNLMALPYSFNSTSVNGTIFTANSDGTITAKGTSTALGTAVIADYTLSAGTYTISHGSSNIGLQVWAMNGSSYTSELVPTFYNGKKTFTLAEATTIRIRVYIAASKTVDESIYPMLNEGSTALPYEPYFEGLRSASVIEVESIGGNLFGGEALADALVEQAYATKNDNQKVVRFSAEYMATLFNEFKPNTAYTIIARGFNEYGNGTNLAVYYTDGSYAPISFSAVKTPSTAVFCTDATKSVKRFGTINYSSYTNLYYNECGIFEGVLTAEDFKPYVKHTLPIPEAVRPANGINENVYDYIEWAEDGSVKKTVKCGVLDLGTLNWNGSGDGRFSANITTLTEYLPGPNSTPIMICAKYQNISPSQWYDKITMGISQSTRGYGAPNSVLVCDINYTDVATFKAAMSGVMLVYELAEPIVTDISDLITSDNLLPVEANGIVTMINEYAYDVPSEIAFYKGQSGAVGADTFVGVLTGVASRSVADENGNKITTTYANKVVEEAQYDISYERSVPANLPTPWSKVTKIGGMSYKTKNYIVYPYAFTTATKNGVTFTANSDGSIGISGTATANAQQMIKKLTKIPQGTYYLSGTKDSVSVYMQFWKGTTWVKEIWVNGSFTVDYSNYDSIDVVAYVSSGVIVNTTIYPMINEGTTKIPYEQYFSGIRDTKVTEIRSIGANLINPEWAQPSGSYSGVTFTKNTNGSITINGTAASDVFYDLIAPAVGGSYILQPNTSYYATLNHDFVDGDNKFFAVGYMVNGASTYPIWGNIGRVFTTPAEFTNLVVRVRAYAGAVFNNVTIYPMIVKSNVAVPYEPYKEDVKVIPAEVQALDGYGLGINENLYNYLEWQPEDYVKTWHKNVGVVDLGTLGWTKREGNNNTFYAAVGNRKMGASNLLTTMYKTENSFANGTVTGNTQNALIYITDNNYTDTASFKAAMSGVMLVYELATPEVTDISELLPDDNFIRVEEGGTIYTENRYHYEAPLEIAYHVDINEARNKGLAVDDMKQSVTRAVYAETALAFSGTSLTIGDTTLTEAQLQKLLALLNEIEFA